MPDHIDLINPDFLPPLMRRFARCIGLDETLRLFNKLGGTRIRVPIDPDKNRSLKGVISDESIAKLAKEMPNERFDLTKPDKAWNQLRDLSIYFARKNGHASAPQLAIKHRLTRRHVINISNKMRKRVATDDLFGGIDNIEL